MEASELCYTSLRGLATLIQRQEVSPVEATQAVIDRVEKFDRQLNSFITLLRDEALTQAHAAEQEILRGPLPWPPAWHPHRRQGPVLHQGYPNDRGLEGPLRLQASVRCHGDHQAA